MEHSLLHRKDLTVLTAIDIINDLGIQGLSTREIAKRQSISEGTLFRHFKNKTEILLSVLDYFSQYDLDIIQSIKLMSLKPIDSITFFIKAFAEYYENYPAITAISQSYEVLVNDQELSSKIKSIFADRYNFIKNTIEEAQKIGQIQTSINSESLADIITGSFSSICLRWRLEGKNFPLKTQTLSTLKMILEAYITH
jgi:AcrR family transcriptional regulator